MRIAHVTTFWPTARFGHTRYTDNLIRGIQVHRPGQHIVLGEGDCAAAETAAYRSIPCWKLGEDYVEAIVGKLRETGVDLAYLQYSPDLFGDDDRFPRLVRRLAESGIQSVANMHSVYPQRWRSRYVPGRQMQHFDRAVAEHASCIQVHSRRMRTDFIERGIPASKLAVIAHGSVAMEQRDVAESRRKLGIPVDAKVVLFFGFIWPGKGLDGLLSSFARLARRVPDAFLYVGGYTRKRVFYTRAYMAYLKARMVALGLRNRAKLWGDYVPEEDVPTVYSAADVVALPYRQDYSSVSGVVHETAGMGKLMLCSRIAKFDEIGESVSEDLCVDPYDKQAWATGMERLLTDRAYAADMRARVIRFAEVTSWAAVGAQHVALQDRLVGTARPAAIAAR